MRPMGWLAIAAMTLLLGVLAIEVWAIRMLAAVLVLLALLACG